MEQHAKKLQTIGLLTFFFSGICAISSGVIVSMLQEHYGFDYSMTGTLLSLMNIGNLLAGFLSGVLPSRLGYKQTVLLLTCGYAVGYFLMGLSGILLLLSIAFFLVGIAKGCTLNTCTILVGNYSSDRTRGMNLMHSFYALGALLCPFIITAAAGGGQLSRSLLVLAVLGAVLWILFFQTPVQASAVHKKEAVDWSFLRNRRFWLLTGLIFCQNAAETSVTGWMVTYFKGNGMIAGFLSPYTVTIMWGATLIARLLIAFVFPFKNPYKAMVIMSIGCIGFYLALMFSSGQLLVLLLLAAFSFSMAGMNPTAVASAGRMTNVTSMGIMLPAASCGAILMPWIIGIVSAHFGLSTGMLMNVIPCIGLLGFSIAVKKLSEKEAA